MSKGEKKVEKSRIPTLSKSRPTSLDVARAAGVSRTQVSYVLNNRGKEHVSEEKRQRIITIANELGYHPQQSAQALRKGFSNEFSIFFPAPYPPRINEILGTIHERGLADNCVPIQYSFNSYRDPLRKNETFKALLARKPRGLFCSLLDLSIEDLQLAQSSGVKNILVLDVCSHEDFVTLLIPAEEVGYIAALHLLQAGYRQLGIIQPADPIQKKAFELRLKGMHRAITSYKDATLTILKWPKENLRPTLEYAIIFFNTLNLSFNKPFGLYAYSDDYALPLMAVARDYGIDFPEKLGIIGTDDISYCALSQPSLTTIRLDNVDLGERAVALINSLITGIPPDNCFIEPPMPKLIARKSTMLQIKSESTAQ